MERLMRRIITLQVTYREGDMHQGGMLGHDEKGGSGDEEKTKGRIMIVLYSEGLKVK